MFSQKNEDNFEDSSICFPKFDSSNTDSRETKSRINREKAIVNRGKRAVTAVSNADVPVSGKGFCDTKAFRDSCSKKQSFTMSSKVAALYHGDIKSDPQGSYTGRPSELSEVPVQDADDL